MAEPPNLRTTESSTLEKAFRITNQVQRSAGALGSHHYTTSLRAMSTWWGYHRPAGQPGLTPHCPLHTEIPSDTQPKPAAHQHPRSFPTGHLSIRSSQGHVFVGTQEQGAVLTLTVCHAVGLGPLTQPTKILCHVWLCPGAVLCNSELLTLHMALQPNGSPLEPSVLHRTTPN